MPIQIGGRPDHDFNEPLGLLSDCHRRIEHFLGVLISVDTEAASGPLTASHRAALETAVRYFAVAAPQHTADEESSLFPRLRDSGDRAAAEALAIVARLEADHDAADQHHAAVDRLVRRWLAENALTDPERSELQEHLRQLQELYRRHIAVEDQQLFPAAASILTNEQKHEIGREMAARRGVRLDASEPVTRATRS